MSDLVGIPEDRFSDVAAQIIVGSRTSKPGKDGVCSEKIIMMYMCKLNCECFMWGGGVLFQNICDSESKMKIKVHTFCNGKNKRRSAVYLCRSIVAFDFASEIGLLL